MKKVTKSIDGEILVYGTSKAQFLKTNEAYSVSKELAATLIKNGSASKKPTKKE